MEETKDKKDCTIKKHVKHFFERWNQSRIRTRLRKNKSFEQCVMDNGMAKLGDLSDGTYKFISAFCDEKLVRRLLEMGFMPGENIEIITNSGSRGSIMVKVKGSKIALSNKIAEKIFVVKDKK